MTKALAAFNTEAARRSRNLFHRQTEGLSDPVRDLLMDVYDHQGVARALSLLHEYKDGDGRVSREIEGVRRVVERVKNKTTEV